MFVDVTPEQLIEVAPRQLGEPFRNRAGRRHGHPEEHVAFAGFEVARGADRGRVIGGVGQVVGDVGCCGHGWILRALTTAGQACHRYSMI